MLYISSLEIFHHRDNNAVQWGKELSFRQLVLGTLDDCTETKKKRICITLRIKINSKRVAYSNWRKANILEGKQENIFMTVAQAKKDIFNKTCKAFTYIKKN